MAHIHYHIEFPLERVSFTQLWGMISTIQGLNRWMDGEVTTAQSLVYFRWSSIDADVAQMSVNSEKKIVSFQWIENGEGFMFEVIDSELTKELSLIIRDECEEEDYESNVQIWKQQVERLLRILGLRL